MKHAQHAAQGPFSVSSHPACPAGHSTTLVSSCLLLAQMMSWTSNQPSWLEHNVIIGFFYLLVKSALLQQQLVSD